MITFRLLGEIDLADEHRGPLDGLLRLPKRMAVLAYLASPAPGAWHRRDTLLAMFWPEHDHEHARSALRNALYVLRQHLGEEVIANRGDEALAVDPSRLRTDVAEVRAALARGDHAAALAGYTGDLLPGLHAIAAGGFEQWLDAERDRLRAEVCDAGRAMADGLERRGDLDAAIQVMRRVLAIDPRDERAVRGLMSLHEHAGDRSGGLQAFESYRAFLAREYESFPAGETVALASRLRIPAQVQDASPRLPPGAVLPPATPGHVRVESPPPAGRKRWGLPLVLAALLFIGWLGLRPAGQAGVIPVLGESKPLTSEPGLQVEPALSPDTRLVAYAAGTLLSLRIMVTRAAGGDPWPLVPDTLGSQRVPRWAPDNDAILFLGGNSAYMAHAVGGDPRLVATGGDDERTVRSASWSPRGDSIAIVRGDSLMVIPREGPGFRLVGTGHQIHTCSWSPTGEWIACVSGNWLALLPGPLFGNRGQSAVVLFPARGGAPIDLTGSANDFRAPTWSPDGRLLWLLSDRDGNGTEAYVASIDPAGRLAAPLRRLGFPAEFVSLSGDRLVYSVPSRRANVFSVVADPDRVHRLADARPETQGNQIIEVVRVSQDGRWLLYDSNARGSSDIYRQPIGGGPIERLTDDPRLEFAPDMSPDDRLVAYHRWEGGIRRLRVLRLHDGRILEPFDRAGDLGTARWSPDGSRLAAWEHGSEPGSVYLLRRDSADSFVPLWHLADAQLPSWLPDGQALGLVMPDGAVHRIPVDSGRVDVLYAPRPGSDDPIVTYIAFDPVRPLLWVLGHRPSGSSGIFVMPASGGTPRAVVNLSEREGQNLTNGPSLTTDGQRLYFTLDEHLSNIRWTTLASP